MKSDIYRLTNSVFSQHLISLDTELIAHFECIMSEFNHEQWTTDHESIFL